MSFLSRGEIIPGDLGGYEVSCRLTLSVVVLGLSGSIWGTIMCLTRAIFQTLCSIPAPVQYGLCPIISTIETQAGRLARGSGLGAPKRIMKRWFQNRSSGRQDDHLA